jgi:hypothetical protein
MGSYCSVDFDDDLHVHSFKSEVPDDRRGKSPLIEADPHNDDSELVKYVSPRAVMLQRLDLLGIKQGTTMASVLSCFAACSQG